MPVGGPNTWATVTSTTTSTITSASVTSTTTTTTTTNTETVLVPVATHYPMCQSDNLIDFVGNRALRGEK